jgi:hypothetical protein
MSEIIGTDYRINQDFQENFSWKTMLFPNTERNQELIRLNKMGLGIEKSGPSKEKLIK